MTADYMFWTTKTGAPMTYGDTARTPVPRRTYRCKASATEPSPHNPAVDRKHVCRITIDHDGDHICTCNKAWAPKEES